MEKKNKQTNKKRAPSLDKCRSESKQLKKPRENNYYILKKTELLLLLLLLLNTVVPRRH
jgi:hypothetical protein